MTARPTKLTDEMSKRAAQKVAAALCEAGCIVDSELSGCADDIATQATRYGDGYSLAKNLDDYCGWDCNFEMAEILNNFSHYASEEIAAAEKQWFAEHAPQPQFSSGTRIKIKSGEHGVVDGIYEYGHAKYLVKIDGDPRADGPSHSRRIIDFEDAEAA